MKDVRKSVFEIFRELRNNFEVELARMFREPRMYGDEGRQPGGCDMQEKGL